MRSTKLNKRSPHAVRRGALLAAAVSVMGVAQVAQGISATWVSAASGTWSTAANWSTNPEFPNNDSPNPGDTYDAVIGATGANYVVTLDSAVIVNSLTLDSGSATFLIESGTLSAVNGLDIRAGTLQFNQGTLTSTTINRSTGGVLGLEGIAFFKSVTLNSDVSLNNGQLYLEGGITLSSRTLSLNSSTAVARVFGLGGLPVNFNGTGTIAFDGTLDEGAIFSGGNEVGVFVGAGIRVQTGAAGGLISLGNAGINHGTISAQTTGKTLRVNGTDWTNSGTLAASNGSTLSIEGTIPVNGLGTIVNNGGTVSLAATVENTGNTLAITTPLLFASGRINGGTLTAAPGGSIVLQGNAILDAVTLDANVSIQTISNPATGAFVGFHNALTLNNRTLTLRSDGGLIADLSSLGSSSLETLGGTGTVIFDGNSDTGRIVTNGGNSGLLIGSGITIRTGSAGGTLSLGDGGTNSGTISAQSFGKTLIVTGTDWSNAGTLAASGGATLSLQGSLLPTGLGNITNSGGTIEFAATVQNAGHTLTFPTPVLFNGANINGGTIAGSFVGPVLFKGNSMLEGVTLDRDAQVEFNPVSNANGIIGFQNGLVLNNRTITLNDFAEIQYNELHALETISGTGTIVFDGASAGNRISNGGNNVGLVIGPGITIRTGAGGGEIFFGNLGTGANNGTISSQTASRGLIVAPNSSITNNGTLLVRNGGTLELSGLQNYNNGVLTGGHYYAYAGSTLSLGIGNVTTNAADIRLDGAGSTFNVIDTLTTNSGKFTVANGRAFNFAGPVNNTSSGAIIAAAGGSIGINGGSNSGTIESQTGGTIVFNGNFNHLANSFLRGSGKVIFNGGIQDFFGTVVGDIDLNITGGQANFRSGSSTSVSLLNVSTNNTILEAGATLNVGPGGLNLTGNSSPAVALGSGGSGAKIRLATGNISVSGDTTAQILTSGSGTNDGVLDLGGVNRTFSIADGAADPDLLITATVASGGLIKSGSGKLQLSNSNSYTGGTTISGGRVSATHPRALGAGSVIFAGGALDLRSDDAITAYPNVLAPLTSTTSALVNIGRITAGTAGTFQLPASTLGSTLSVTGEGTFQLAGATLTNNLLNNSGTTVEIAGPITGNFGITHGSGFEKALIFSGSSANTYTGPTTVQVGTLKLKKTTGNAIPGNLTLIGGFVELLGSHQIADNAIVSINNFATVRNIGFTDSIGGFAVNEAVLENSGTLTLLGASNLNLAYLTHSGTLINSTTGVMSISAALRIEQQIENFGVINAQDNLFVGQNVGYFGYSILNRSTGVMNIGNNVNFNGNQFSPSTIVNAGVINKTGAGTSRLVNANAMTFNNSGTINVTAGTMEMSPGTNSGTFNTAVGATIAFTGSTSFLAGTNFTGGGTVRLNNGANIVVPSPLSIQSPVEVIAGANLVLNSPLTLGNVNFAGSVDGAADLILPGVASFTTASHIGLGKTIISSTGQATFSSGGHFIIRTIQNAGTTTFASGFGVGGLAQPEYSFQNLAGGVFNINGNTLFLGNSFGFSTVTNAGTLNKINAGTALLANIGFTNSGTVNVNSGTLILPRGSSSGTINVATGGSLNFQTSGTFNIMSGSSISGTGAFFITGGTTHFNTPTTLQGPLTIINSGLVNNSPLNLNDLSLAVAGSIDGTADLTIAGSATFVQASMRGTGKTILASTAIATVSGGGTLWERTIENNGVMNFASGFSVGAYNGVGPYTLVNKAGGVMNVSSATFNTNEIGITNLSNAGTLNKSGSNLTRIFNAVFTNSGTVNVGGGTFAPEFGSNSGRMNVDAGTLTLTTVFANNGTIATNGGVLLKSAADGASFGNAGTITINGGGMVFDHLGIANPSAPIRAQLATGFANGAWNGPGINSAAAAANPLHNTGIGYADGSALGIVGSGSFLGGSVDATSVLVRYTLTGDSTLDGQVTTADFDRLSINFNQSGKVWFDGDYNYDGKVNALDFNAIASNFGMTLPGDVPALGSVVPEPSTLAIAGVVWALVQRRRRQG